MPRPLSEFATHIRPLHPSGLGSLLECPWRAVLNYWSDEAGEGGPAGDTGSAMHAAAAAFHRGKDLAASIAEMQEKLGKYPLADLQEAASMFLKYASDPRNSGAQFPSILDTPFVEHSIAFEIAPAAEDQTQQPIQVIGTVDQVRRHEDGKLRAHDIKTSKKEPMDLLAQHVHQMAAYCVGASMALGETVHPGSLICPRRYRADVSTSPVFWYYTFSFSDIPHILAGVRHVVARIRAGDVWHKPNANCKYCVGKSPDICFPKLVELRTQR
jgi:hypothetical protein